MSTLGPSPLTDGNELPVATARALIHQALRPLGDQPGDIERLPLPQTLGRVLAADVISPIDVPAHDNSAMDGYAFNGADLQLESPTELKALATTVFAGQPLAQTLARGECVRIMTGAVMPTGLDTVVPIELCEVLTVDGAQRVRIQAGRLRPGENRRKRGEDLSAGRPALSQGHQLRPADLGLIASLGIEEVSVYRRLRVALFSTGDEIRTLGQPLEAGCIYDSNRYSLMGALQRLGVDIIDLGLVRDDPAALRATLDQAIASADVVLTSGGVSMGDADYTRDILAERGEVAFWKVAMRPGRPFAFGPLHLAGSAASTASAAGARQPLLFALPGNPVAALVTFYAFAREALQVLSGGKARPLPALKARSAAAIRKRPGRTEYQRGIVEAAPDGGWQVRLTGAQGAGILRSMSEANALVVLAHEQASVAAAEEVTVWLFDGLV